jgi:hypothetical protein
MSNAPPQPGLRFVPMDEVVIYPVRESELETLEKGGATSTIFGMATWFVGMGIGLLGCLLTSSVPVPITARFVIMVVATSVFLVAGLVLIVLWLRRPNETKAVVARIRARDQTVAGTKVPIVSPVKPGGGP